MILEKRTQFMTSPEPSCMVRNEEVVEEIPAGFRLNAIYIETKSKRVNLVMRPSLHKRTQQKALEEGISFNDYVHRLIERDIEQAEKEV